jgi:fibronectin type 3 domain-containing protein
VSVAGYRVYYGTVSRSYLQALGAGLSTGNNTSYVVTGLPRGYMYYFSVTAIDAAGNESAFSNEATKHVQ